MLGLLSILYQWLNFSSYTWYKLKLIKVLTLRNIFINHIHNPTYVLVVNTNTEAENEEEIIKKELLEKARREFLGAVGFEGEDLNNRPYS